MKLDSAEARKALADIDDVARRVRQSRIYDLASRVMIMWGVLVFAGNLANWLSPRDGGAIWIAVNTLGVGGTVTLSILDMRRTGMHSFDLRVAAAFVLYFAFGLFCSVVLGHFGPRQMGTFWPVYAMLFYVLAGLWFGRAFVAIGLGITVLTLIGYFFVTGYAFMLWMAVTNGGGLIVGGLCMRRD
ncbi:hypothetical protein [Bradyrhizobium sp.]|uniref:hypothetical protein n=1 Tax=Bradyrhizobium sp. TaxID=376 RepID=UPI001EC8AABB|nr:hypothetical protein [Bradyrhizobium sp.]MBV8921658.1 hypothetical protein [Bradyrhizobium sp.]MBV9984389.1 hypothetical protein [Bradyrhizobium sp.]